MEFTLSQFVDDPSWGDWVIHQMVVSPSETVAGWRNGQRGIWASSTWGNAKLCISGGLNLLTRTCWGLTDWKAAWGPDRQQDDHDLAKHPHTKRSREVILHLYLALVGQQVQFCVQFLLTSTILWSTPKILLAEQRRYSSNIIQGKSWTCHFRLVPRAQAASLPFEISFVLINTSLE